jgi:hypothetical protein
MDKHFSDSFPIQNGLKQDDGLSLPLLNFTLEYDIRMVQEIQVGPKMNGTHHTSHADHMNILEDNTKTINKNTESLTSASNEVSMVINIR